MGGSSSFHRCSSSRASSPLLLLLPSFLLLATVLLHVTAVTDTAAATTMPRPPTAAATRAGAAATAFVRGEFTLATAATLASSTAFVAPAARGGSTGGQRRGPPASAPRAFRSALPLDLNSAEFPRPGLVDGRRLVGSPLAATATDGGGASRLRRAFRGDGNLPPPRRFRSPSPSWSTRLSAREGDPVSASIPVGDTVFALSSGGGGYGGSGATAVAVIRLTGPRSFDALEELLSPRDCGVNEEKEAVRLPKPRVASLRMLYDPRPPSPTSSPSSKRERDPLDSSLVLTFPGPRSFTGEDVVELHCHGSRAVVRGVLDALSSLEPSMGLRPADPGEFTQRAYSSGKLGLVEVEALADLIVADTSLQRKQALRQFDGRLSRLYLGWRKELIKGLAHAEAVIDFGDDESSSVGDEDTDVWGGIVPRMRSLRQAMERHLSDASRGEILRDGLRVAIVGRPNAGKSSLLNALAGRDAAIVSSTPGTTRDVVEVALDLGGVRCSVSDTAGVRDGTEGGVDEVEMEGMRRARTAARDAHIVVGVIDATDRERGMEAVRDLLRGAEDGEDAEDEGYEPVDSLMGDAIYVFNKMDLVDSEQSLESGDVENGRPSFGISCATGAGVDNFLSSLAERAVARVAGDDGKGEGVDESDNATAEGVEGAVITRTRHRRHVEAAADALSRFDDLSGTGHLVDLAAEELRLAASELGRITGAIDIEDVLDVLFAEFCIGK